jgi:xanthine dehydrogenase accessory factor
VAVPEDILTMAAGMRAKGMAFAMATVVRTVAVTAAKAGAKALIASDGCIFGGWIGGGCARSAVIKAATAALADGRPRLISVQPQDILAEQGIKAGEAKNGIEFAKTMCPSRGTMDIFIEPFLPRPHLIICGASPVAVALAELASRMGFLVSVAAASSEHGKFGSADRMIDDLPSGERADYIVVATQGTGDAAALRAALTVESRYLAFVGSRQKAAALKAKLEDLGVSPERLASLRAPAGLDLGAITPDEIALSIVAEMIEVRRLGQRQSSGFHAGIAVLDP